MPRTASRWFIALITLATGPSGAHGQALDLAMVYRQALEQDTIYQQNQARHAANIQQAPQARAALLPSLTLTGYSRYNAEDVSLSGRSSGGQNGEPGGFGGESNYNSRGYQLKLSQTLFNFESWLGLDLAQINILVSELNLESAGQDLMLRVAERYFDVLARQDDLTFAGAEKRSLERQLAEAKQNFDLGLVAITDVHEAQAGYDRAVASEILADNQLSNSREALHEISNHYPETLAPLHQDIPLAEPEPANMEDWITRALENNLQVAAARHELQAARKRVAIQRSTRYPNLNLVADHGYNRGGGRFGGFRTHNSVIGIEVAAPLYQGGLIQSRIHQAEAESQEAESRLRQQIRAARRMTREAYLGVLSGISQVQARRQAVASSDSALFASRSGFKVGTRTAVDVVVAERSAFSAKRDYALARYNYVLSTLQLRRATGQLQASDLRTVNGWLNTDEQP